MASAEGMLPADVLERPELERQTRAVVDRLLAEKGFRRYVIFDEDEEASEILPDGIYPVSGAVLTDEGRVFRYWLDWHADQDDYTLGEADGFWSEVDISEYEDDPDEYYQAAKRKLGLPQRLPSRYTPPSPQCAHFADTDLCALRTAQHPAPVVVTPPHEPSPGTLAGLTRSASLRDSRHRSGRPRGSL